MGCRSPAHERTELSRPQGCRDLWIVNAAFDQKGVSQLNRRWRNIKRNFAHIHRSAGHIRRPRWGIGGERRRYPRIPLAIPLFLRGIDKAGKPFLDFTLALNLGAGGALFWSRRTFPLATKLSLEIPTPPVPGLPLPMQSKRAFQGRVIRGISEESLNLYAIRFARPLV